MNRQSISERDLMFLIISFLIGTAIMLLPPAVVSEAKQDAWLALLIGTIISIILARQLFSLQKSFPNQSLIQYSVKLLGLPTGKAIGAFFLFFALLLNIFIIRNIGDFVKATILPNTPVLVIHAIAMLIVAYAVRGGLEIFARVIIILLPLSLLFFIIISVMTLPNQISAVSCPLWRMATSP